MRKMLNVLYVTTPGAYLAKDGENIVVRVLEEEKFKIPAHTIEGIVCFGYAGASPALMHHCAENNIGLSFLTEHGKYMGRITGHVSGNVLLRRKQYRFADEKEKSISIANTMIAGKIANCRTILQRAQRENNIPGPELETAILKLSRKIRLAQNASNAESLRGIEGEAASIYFSMFNYLITQQKQDFVMNGRNRRPPRDNINAMLSFLYTLLMHEVQSALETVGIDPYVGFLHTDRPGRPGMALDMMEELRPIMADRLAVSLINLKQVQNKGFIKKESGGITMDDDTRKTLITAWQKRKQTEITHPYLNVKIPFGLIPYLQALLLSRFLRGDIDAYPVFIYK